MPGLAFQWFLSSIMVLNLDKIGKKIMIAILYLPDKYFLERLKSISTWNIDFESPIANVAFVEKIQ